MSSLEVYVPKHTSFTLNGNEIKVYPLKVRQVTAFTQELKQLLSMDFNKDIISLIAENTNLVVDAISIATDIPAQDFSEAYLEEISNAALAVIEVNHDFFVTRLPQVITQITKLIGG